MKKKTPKRNKKRAERKKEELVLIRVLVGLGVIFGVLFSQFFMYPTYEEVQLGDFSKNLFDNVIPEVYFYDLNNVILTKESSINYEKFDYSNPNNKSNLGSYNIWLKRIIIFEVKDKTKYSLDETMLHEINHHIFYNFISNEEREEWKLIYNTTKKEDFITNYASKNYLEDFADNMRIYLNNQGHYIRCYFRHKSSCRISEDRLNFIIEKIVMIYEPEKFRRIRGDMDENYKM